MFVADGLSWIFLVAGGAFVMIGGLGVLRLPDMFTRLHAAGITDTLGATLVVLGMLLQAGWTLTSVKLLLILGFGLISSPTATHALAQAALSVGITPLGTEDRREAASEGPDPSKT